MKFMMLAAGRGARLKPITEKIPKPAMPLLNVPMMFYPVQYLPPEAKIILNTFHLEDVLKKTLAKHAKNFGAEVISDGPALLGSGGGIKNAEAFLKGDGNFCVFNSDSIFLADNPGFVERAKEFHLKNKALATLVVIEDPRIESQGWGAIWEDKNGKVVALGKSRPPDAINGFHFVGFMIVSDKIFKFLPPGESHVFEDGFIPAMMAGELVQTYKTSGRWFETGNAADYLASTRFLIKELQNNSQYLMGLQRQFHPQFRLFTKNSIFDKPMNTSALDCLLTSEQFSVGGGVKLEGFAVLGDQVSIGAGCHIANAVLLDGATVPKNSVIRNQIIGCQAPAVR